LLAKQKNYFGKFTSFQIINWEVLNAEDILFTFLANITFG